MKTGASQTDRGRPARPGWRPSRAGAASTTPAPTRTASGSAYRFAPAAHEGQIAPQRRALLHPRPDGGRASWPTCAWTSTPSSPPWSTTWSRTPTYELDGHRDQRFGTDVARMVDGVTKISEIRSVNPEARKAETYRKLVLSIAQDPRTVLIKLADRLHNMRTIEFLDARAPARHRPGDDGRLRAAGAPLRHRPDQVGARGPGLQGAAARSATSRSRRGINQTRAERERLRRGGARAAARRRCARPASTAQVTGRPKHFYSIYRKMKAQEIGLDRVFDLLALRVVVETKADCYHALGVHPQPLPADGRPHQGLHRDRPSRTCTSRCTRRCGAGRQVHRGADPHRGDARAQRAGHRRPLALQGGRPATTPTSPAGEVAAPDHGVAAGRRRSARVHGDREDRLLPGRGLRLQPRRRPLPAAARRRRRWTSPSASTPRSACAASAPRSTAASSACARRCRTATRSRSSPRKTPGRRASLARRSSRPAAPSTTSGAGSRPRSSRESLRLGREILERELRRGRSCNLKLDRDLVDVAQQMGYTELDKLLAAVGHGESRRATRARARCSRRQRVAGRRRCCDKAREIWRHAAAPLARPACASPASTT